MTFCQVLFQMDFHKWLRKKNEFVWTLTISKFIIMNTPIKYDKLQEKIHSSESSEGINYF